MNRIFLLVHNEKIVSSHPDEESAWDRAFLLIDKNKIKSHGLDPELGSTIARMWSRLDEDKFDVLEIPYFQKNTNQQYLNDIIEKIDIDKIDEAISEIYTHDHKTLLKIISALLNDNESQIFKFLREIK